MKQAASTLEAPPPGGSPGARILVIEDSETQALLLRLQLEAEGFGVDRCATAEAALDRLNERLPDLVVADYHLPGMNGDELTRQMRANLRTRSTPVLMLTEARGRDIERQGLESGADAYVPKSADRDLLILRIRALLRERGASPAAESSAHFAALRRARILVVDADEAHRALVARLFEGDGHEVVALVPEEATARLAAAGALWDCVAVDLSRDPKLGLSLCRTIAGMRGRPGAGSGFHLVGIDSEGGSSKEVLVEAFAAGADDVVAMATDGDALLMRVRTLVRRKLRDEERRRIAEEISDRELAVARARAETAAAEAKAAMADALEQANQDLEDANRKLQDTQAKLVQAAKMASLGELVAGIAHEINNPLAFILAHQGTVERLLAEIGDPVREPEAAQRRLGKCRDRVNAMRMGLTRIQDLVLNLRKFSRLDEGELQTVNVAEAIDTVVALIQHKLGTRIAVERQFTGSPEMCCSPALLNQVVMNILGNAADAMAEAGTITVRTETEEDSDVIRISDTGPGVPETLRERIFEPFFTTKPVGSGTGLGLAIAYSVVQAHRGNITVEAAPGGGASFVISIPRRQP